MSLGTTALVVGAGAAAYGAVSAGNASKDAAGSAADALRALDPSVNFEELFAFNNPNLGNASLGAFQAAVLQQLGAPGTASALQQASPLGLAINAIGASGNTEGDFDTNVRQVNSAANNYLAFRRQGYDAGAAARATRKKLGDGRWSEFRMAVRTAGFENPVAFLEQQHSYETQAQQIAAENEASAPGIREGRLNALERISGIQGDFPDTSEAGLQAIRELIRAENIRERTESEDEQRAIAAERAQTFGTNPGGVFGQIAEQALQDRLDIDIDSLREALLLQGGQVTNAGNSLIALQNSLNSPLQAAGNAAQLFSQGQQAQGSVAAQQANILNQIRAANARAETANRLGLQQDASGLDLQGQLAQINARNQAIQTGASAIGSLGGSFGGGLTPQQAGNINADLNSVFAANPSVFGTGGTAPGTGK